MLLFFWQSVQNTGEWKILNDWFILSKFIHNWTEEIALTYYTIIRTSKNWKLMSQSERPKYSFISTNPIILQYTIDKLKKKIDKN